MIASFGLIAALASATALAGAHLPAALSAAPALTLAPAAEAAPANASAEALMLAQLGAGAAPAALPVQATPQQGQPAPRQEARPREWEPGPAQTLPRAQSATPSTTTTTTTTRTVTRPGAATPAPAPAPQAAGVRELTGAEQRAAVDRAAASLTAVRTASGTFIQRETGGGAVTGTFALQRPGRVRFSYDEPVPLLIVADGTTVVLQDSELETEDRVPLSATPLGLVLDDRIDLGTEADVTRVVQRPGVLEVTLRSRDPDTTGTLTLRFDSGSDELLGWIAEDVAGLITQVDLVGVETGMRLSPRLFRVEDFADADERGDRSSRDRRR